MREKLLALLVPSFLRKLDRWLLMNHPRWWATKAHYVVFYGVIVNLFGMLFGQVFFNYAIFDAFFVSTTRYFIFVMITWIMIFLVEISILILWFNALFGFNLEQNYANTHYLVGLIETIVYSACIMILFLPPFITLTTGIYKFESYYSFQNTNFLWAINWYMFFVILGVVFTQIFKHGNWRDVILSFLYLLLLVIIFFILAIISYYFFPINPDNRIYDYNSIGRDFVVVCAYIGMPLWMIIQFVQSIRTKTYKHFAFINLVCFPVVLAVITMLVSAQLIKLVSPTDFNKFWIVAFLIYLVFTPIQKKILIYLISLPRD